MKNKLVKTALVSGVLLATISTSLVSGAEAGSNSDPLVTKSYVDSKISNLRNTMIEMINDNSYNNNDNNYNNNYNNNNNGSIITTPVVQDSQYKVIAVPNGSMILGGEGTEMILRSGKANVVSSTTNGLVNMTTGNDALNGSNVEKNNLMIVPRADGRGFKITTDGANVMVRGYYEIK